MLPRPSRTKPGQLLGHKYYPPLVANSFRDLSRQVLEVVRSAISAGRDVGGCDHCGGSFRVSLQSKTKSARWMGFRRGRFLYIARLSSELICLSEPG